MSNMNERPLSPHLQIYKPQMTTIMSILHRATGVALVFGCLMVIWWLMAAATGEHAYNVAMGFAMSPLGTFMLVGWTFSLYYHLFDGIRHLFWDMGYLFELKNAFRAGWVVWFVTLLFTAATWYCAIMYVHPHHGGLQNGFVVKATDLMNSVKQHQ